MKELTFLKADLLKLADTQRKLEAEARQLSAGTHYDPRSNVAAFNLAFVTGALEFACCCIAQNKSVDEFLSEHLREAIM